MLLFKAFERYDINLFAAIVVNYWVCVATGLLSSPKVVSLLNNDLTAKAWPLWAIALGFIFISGFFLIGKTTQLNGVTVATIASKTSMVLPVMAAVYLYGDSITFWKISGVILALVAIFLTSSKSGEEASTSSTKGASLILPFSIFLIGGIIEIILNYNQQYYLNSELENALFTIFIFAMAAIIGSIVLLVRRLSMTRKDVLAGILLGIPNYGSILFLLAALDKSGLESSVFFTVLNMGIVLTAAAGSMLLFKERLSPINFLGIGAAIAAICLMLV